jgi:hypothetical protein
MKEELKIDRSNPRSLQTLFGTYGYRPAQSVLREADGYRIRLPAVSGVGQTGAYSYFVLAGDCEVVVAYELLTLQPPRQGYGSGVGLAFDAGDEVGRGSIQRVHKPGDGDGHVLQSGLVGASREMKEEYRFVPATARGGRLGLRRTGKELVFLASDSSTAPLQEIDRLPFTDRTIRAVRFFADAGGSPIAVDVRVRQIGVRAEEITGGIPEREAAGSRWWWLWLAVPAAGGGLLFWRIRKAKREAAALG